MTGWIEDAKRRGLLGVDDAFRRGQQERKEAEQKMVQEHLEREQLLESFTSPIDNFLKLLTDYGYIVDKTSNSHWRITHLGSIEFDPSSIGTDYEIIRIYSDDYVDDPEINYQFGITFGINSHDPEKIPSLLQDYFSQIIERKEKMNRYHELSVLAEKEKAPEKKMRSRFWGFLNYSED